MRMLSILMLLAVLVAMPLAAGAADPDAATVQLMEKARKAGGKGTLPNAWWDLEVKVREARTQGDAANWNRVESQARRLAGAAEFLNQMRQQKSGLEALLGRFDQALGEIAAIYGMEVAPDLSGSPAAKDLIERMTAANFRRQVVVDSLTVANRRLVETVGGRAEALEAQAAAQQAEISELRKKLWNTELRVGVAEADRSAAETVLGSKQEREAKLAALRALFSKNEAEIIVTAEGAVVMRLFGVSFDVGSANLAGGQEKLIGRVVEAVRTFPGATVAIEGHTDDTGTRAANQTLSLKRAETVARLLEGKLSLGSGTIETAGFGPDRPLALNSTPEGRARNRRIDLTITPE